MYMNRGVKFKDYRANGVQEYWIVDANTNVLEQYLLQDDELELHQKFNKNKQTLTSKVIKGLGVPVGAFFDASTNLDLLKTL